MMRMREQSQFMNMNRQPQMMQAQANQLANMRRNGAMNTLQKTVLQNNSQMYVVYPVSCLLLPTRLVWKGI
jgi:hypothetical protein